MPTLLSKTCGYDLQIPGPQDVETYDRLAGRSGASLMDACRYLWLHSGGREVWENAFAKELERLTGIIRLVDETATSKARKAGLCAADSVVLETVKKYNLRVRGSVNLGKVPGVSLADLTVAAQKIAAGMFIDPTPVRSRSRPSATGLEKAELLLAGDPVHLENKIREWTTEFPEFYLERDNGAPSADSLGRLIDLKHKALLDLI